MVVKASVVSLASVLLLSSSQDTTAQNVFPASDVSGAFAQPNGAELRLPASTARSGTTTINRPKVTGKGKLLRMCGCTPSQEPPYQPAVGEIRAISDKWFKDGVAPSSYGFSNLVWAWGQFIDHDIVATVDGDDESVGPADNIVLRSDRGMMATMKLHPLISDTDSDGCPVPTFVNTPIVDAGTVYGDEPGFLESVLRVGGDSCMLRTSDEGNMLPISNVKNSEGNYFFVAGDARVDEHAVLTMMHTIWMREHNRLCDFMNNDPTYASMSPNAKFNKARNVVIAKIQDITVREWLPLLGISESELRSIIANDRTTAPAATADLTVEFSTAVYRFGHDLVPDKLGPHPTVELFDGNKFFGIQNTGKGDMTASHKLDDVALFAAQSRANQIDGKFSDTLRNTLFGSFGEDLAARNIYRGRDMRLKSYRDVAECFGVDGDGLVDDEVPLFVGVLHDNYNPKKNVFGPVQHHIISEQFARTFFGSGGDWWENRLGAVSGFEDEIHRATFGSVINDNTRSFVQTNAFKVSGGGGKKAPYGEVEEEVDGDDCCGGSGSGGGGSVFDGLPSFPDHFNVDF